jgi:sarcosine oxidase subunit gamma
MIQKGAGCMAEAFPRQGILTPDRLAQGPHLAGSLRVLPAMAQFIFRGDAAAVAEAGTVFGAPLPSAPCCASCKGTRAALWLGPDEYLLIAQEDQGPAIAAAIAAALSGMPHSLVAVGHRNVAIEIAGPQAATLLNAGCPLDLDETAFPIFMCTRTILAKAQIVLWRTASRSFHVTCWRSFTPYIWDFLIEARMRLPTHSTARTPEAPP